MSKYVEDLQRFWRQYEAAGNPTPATARDVARWAIENHLWQPQHSTDLVGLLAEDLARAWREEYRLDKKGRRYRAKHAVRVTQGGVQYSFWADIDTAPRPHIVKAFGQRRNLIVGECYQLKTDADHYSDAHSEEPAIQIVLDFTHDVQELQELDDKGDEAA